MARYFFDLKSTDGAIRDDAGMEIASRDQLAKEISTLLLDVACDEVPSKDLAVFSVAVRNEGGATVSVAFLTYQLLDLQ